MQYANTDDTEHTDGLLLVDKAQGENSVCIFCLSGSSVIRLTGEAGQYEWDDWLTLAAFQMSATWDDGGQVFIYTTTTWQWLEVVRTKEWIKGNTLLSLCTWFFLTFKRVRKTAKSDY